MKNWRLKEPDLTHREAEAFIYLFPVLAFAVMSVIFDLMSSRDFSSSRASFPTVSIIGVIAGSQLAWLKGFKLRPLLSLSIFLFIGLGAYAKNPSDTSFIVHILFWPLTVLLFVGLFNWRLGKNLR